MNQLNQIEFITCIPTYANTNINKSSAIPK